jgi:hypothetical protein
MNVLLIENDLSSGFWVLILGLHFESNDLVVSMA